MMPAPVEYMEDVGGGERALSIDLFAILAAALRRWKLIITISLLTLIATYGVLKFVPLRYKSAVEILVYDPQQQINAAVQKPISPFVEAVGSDAMNTEIDILKSKSVALRVASELGLDMDREFQAHNLFVDFGERLGLHGLSQLLKTSGQSIGDIDDGKAGRLDHAADVLLANVQVWQEAFVLFVTATSQSPIMAQRLASTIAKDYLASQREARQEALERVATWLKGRVDSLQSQALEAEASIEKLKAESEIGATELSNLREQQIGELNTQLTKARAEVDEKRARLEQVRRVIATNGDIQSIPELTASATLTELRRRLVEQNSRATDLQNKLGERHLQVIAIRAELAAISQQMSAETEHILGNMKNSYDIAVRQEQSLEASLQSLTADISSGAYVKLRQLQRVADADRKLYESYLSQYNDISERRTLQDASARIISPATLPRLPSSPRSTLFYMLGGTFGLGGGFLFAFLLEYFLRPGVRTGTELEQSFGRPVVGAIPLVRHRKARGPIYNQLLQRMADEPFLPLIEAIHSVRISLKLSNANSKVILITSALPGEGKSTAAMLLAVSSANSGRRTILLDCDLRQPSTSEALRKTGQPGLSELLSGTAKLTDVITQDPVANSYVIPAGSMVPNPADLLMSQQMGDLVAGLRDTFDYIVLDTPPLLAVVDALAVATLADCVLVIVEWSQTARDSISEAFKVLRPEAHRVAGIVLNKVDLNQLPGYGYRGGYGSAGKYPKN
jgi:polysaccharide biosynthesis transport protein